LITEQNNQFPTPNTLLINDTIAIRFPRELDFTLYGCWPLLDVHWTST